MTDEKTTKLWVRSTTTRPFRRAGCYFSRDWTCHDLTKEQVVAVEKTTVLETSVKKPQRVTDIEKHQASSKENREKVETEQDAARKARRKDYEKRVQKASKESDKGEPEPAADQKGEPKDKPNEQAPTAPKKSPKTPA